VLDGSPQVRQADAQASAARAQVSAARAEYWPTLSASYSNSYASVDTLGRFAVQPWLTTQSYVNSWGLRFSLSWTLFNGFTREADQVSAAVQRDVADAHAADLRRQVNALYTQQVSDLFTADAQIGITAANVAAAAEALRVQQERYRLGAATLLDLLTAEANLTQAEVNQVQARYTYLIARAQLEALVGRSL
jgi:outer membrane protein TolC